jgi:hypothetical protein
VVSGNQVAVLDPSAFALADRSLMFVTGGISQVLRDRFNGIGTGAGGGGATALSFAGPDNLGIAGQTQAAFSGFPSVAMAYASDPKPILGKAPAAVPYYDTTVWASGFGGQRIQDAYGTILPATDTAFGGAVGIDRMFASNWRLGAFVGAGAGREDVSFGVQTVDTPTSMAACMGTSILPRSFSILRSMAAAWATTARAGLPTIWCRAALRMRPRAMAAGSSARS